MRRYAAYACVAGSLVLVACTDQVPGTPTPAATATYSCQARSVTGRAYTQFRSNGHPLSVSIPKLPDWRSAPTALRENQLALMKTIGTTQSYVALSILRPEPDRDKASAQLSKLTRFDPSVSIVQEETVNVCSLEASRLAGIAENRGLRFDYLNLAYPANGVFYPIQLRNQMGAGDVPLFGTDVDVIFRNLQIGP
jgi:hypothetical protein